MLAFDSIAQKFRLSYLIFAGVLCLTFVSIFFYASTELEQVLVKSHLIAQLSESIEQSGFQDHYHADPGIDIYRFDAAPAELQAKATDTVQETAIEQSSKTSQHNQAAQESKAINQAQSAREITQVNELHFFTHNYLGQRYILTYLQEADVSLTDYPVLAIYEHFEEIFLQTLLVAVLLSFLVAILFSYLSAYQITKPLLDLKEAVDSDHDALSKLTHLPSEVGILARAIDDKNQKLAKYLLREQLFTGDVSHELRTPLTIMMGAAEVLQSQLPTDSPQHEFAQRIHDTATETSEIITALLLLSRAPEKLDAPTTPINPIIESEVHRLGYLLRDKNVNCEITTQKIYTAQVRPELLKMAVGNLIKNAFQYTESGQVTISINDAYITVADTGIGIPKSMMVTLFERFQRGDETNIEGSGLGLSIVQRIMIHLGWQLRHEINGNGGNTFRIYYHPKPQLSL